MVLEQGRPANWTERLPKEIRCYDLLDSLAVPYQRIDHEAAMTMEACAAIDEALNATICKNLLLCNRQCTSFYLLMIPGSGRAVGSPSFNELFNFCLQIIEALRL